MPLQATSGAASYDAFGGGVPVEPNYIESVFSCFLYTGSNSAQTITNGIDLSTKGGLVWTKVRTTTFPHCLTDTLRGGNKQLFSNTTDASTTSSPAEISSFNSTGYTLTGGTIQNVAGQNFVGWTFREQPKFFKIVTYTGNGNGSSRAIPLPAGWTAAQVGCYIVKSTTSTENWYVWNRGLDTGEVLVLNSTAAKTFTGAGWGPAGSNFFVGGTDIPNAGNQNGQTYVAYLFAHNAGGFGLTGTDNVISCGSFTTDGSNQATVELGYEPQWIITKRVNAESSWNIIDNMRSWNVGGTDNYLFANLSNAEATFNIGNPTATGFFVNGYPTDTYIYIAIRRGPMKVPTTGTSVFSLQTYTGDDSTRTLTTGFPVDLAIGSSLSSSAGNSATFSARLTGTNRQMNTASTGAEVVGGSSLTGFDIQTGVGVNGPSNFTYNFGSIPYVLPALRRAPGFMDVCCFTGTGVNSTVAHNLAAVPELMIVKRRNAVGGWVVYSAASGPTNFQYLNTTAAASPFSTTWNNTAPTASVFTVGTDSEINASGGTFVAYLFASCPGVSKVGSYTGTGTTQTINCGFTGGARFVLIKATSTTGDWYVWDSARGIVAGNDPYLRWNVNGNQVTNTDWVDTAATGFELSNAGGNLANSNGVSYIFWAVA